MFVICQMETKRFRIDIMYAMIMNGQHSSNIIKKILKAMLKYSNNIRQSFDALTKENNFNTVLLLQFTIVMLFVLIKYVMAPTNKIFNNSVAFGLFTIGFTNRTFTTMSIIVNVSISLQHEISITIVLTIIMIFFIYIIQQQIKLGMEQKFQNIQNIQNNYDYDNLQGIDRNYISKSIDSILIGIEGNDAIIYDLHQIDLIIILFMYLNMILQIIDLKKRMNWNLNLKIKMLIVVIYLTKLFVLIINFIVVYYHNKHHL